jgi:hypothetical protein
MGAGARGVPWSAPTIVENSNHCLSPIEAKVTWKKHEPRTGGARIDFWSLGGTGEARYDRKRLKEQDQRIREQNMRLTTYCWDRAFSRLR